MKPLQHFVSGEHGLRMFEWRALQPGVQFLTRITRRQL
jgi:hypothetical protein